MAGNGWIHNSKRGSRGPNEEGLTWGRPGSWVMVRSCCARFTSGRTRSYAGPVSFEPIAVSAIATAPAAARTAALADRRLAPLGRPAADGSARQCRWAASFIEFRDCQPAPRSLPRFRARRTTRIGTAHWQYPRSTLLVLPALREADDRSSVHSPSPPLRRLSDLLATGLLAPQVRNCRDSRHTGSSRSLRRNHRGPERTCSGGSCGPARRRPDQELWQVVSPKHIGR